MSKVRALKDFNGIPTITGMKKGEVREVEEPYLSWWIKMGFVEVIIEHTFKDMKTKC
jgi:hypothetical protein